MHQELLSEDHVFWTTFGINIRVLMLQRKETSVMLNYVNTVSDMKLSISCETNILISRDTILGQTGPGGENDIIIHSQLRRLRICLRTCPDHGVVRRREELLRTYITGCPV